MRVGGGILRVGGGGILRGGILRVGGYEVGVYEGWGVNVQGIVRNTYRWPLYGCTHVYRWPLCVCTSHL